MTDRIIKTAVRPLSAPAGGARGEQFLGFLAAGGFATAVHWSIMWMLLVVNQEPLHATAFGAAAGAIANYFLQRRLTFDIRGPHAGVMLRYLISCVAAWLGNLLVFQCLIALAMMSTGIAQGMTTAIVSVMNYLMYRRLVFHG